MSTHSPEETIQQITHSKEVVSTSGELTSSRRKVLNKYFVAIAILFVLLIFTYYFLSAEQLVVLQATINKDNYLFYWMLLIGFGAEVIAGSMGMGYGVICTSLLLILNVPPPVVSASIHSAESFTSAAGTISHW
ncbi:MAG: TSUP family transporter, partial [Ferruginibacter sp.]